MDFSEEQKMNSRLIMILFSAASLVAIGGIVVAIITMQQQGEDITSMFPALLVVMVSLGVSWYMLFGTRLETQISNSGITYRYFPMVRKYVTIPFSEVHTWKYKTIKNIFEYGGYGYRNNVLSKKKAFIMGGKEVFEFTLNNGKIIAFTSASAYMLTTALRKHMAEKELK